MILTHMGLLGFFSGVGSGGFVPPPTPTPTPDNPFGGKGDNERRGPRIVKPTGIVERKPKRQEPKLGRPTLEDRIVDTQEIHREVLAKAPVAPVLGTLKLPPAITMTPEEIDFEIGVLLRKKLKTQEEELLLLLLMAASAAG